MSTGRNEAEGQKFQVTEIWAVEKAVRRIVRAHDLQSRALVKRCGLTSAQLVLMRGICELGEVTSAALSVYADISAATVVTILDNLEERGLIERYRSGSDRRIVHTRLTEAGKGLMDNAPEPMGEAFLNRFSGLSSADRRAIVETLARLAELLAATGEPPPVPVSAV